MTKVAAHSRLILKTVDPTLVNHETVLALKEYRSAVQRFSKTLDKWEKANNTKRSLMVLSTEKLDIEAIDKEFKVLAEDICNKVVLEINAKVDHGTKSTLTIRVSPIA